MELRETVKSLTKDLENMRMLLRQQERQNDGGASEKSGTNRKGQDSRGKDRGSGNTHKGNDALAPSGRNVSPQ